MSHQPLAWSIGAMLLFVAAPSSAEPMDPAIERLVLDPACRTNEGAFVDDPANIARLESGPGMSGWCAPDQVAFKKLINQYSFAFAPNAMHPARTTGVSGFELTIEGSFTTIDSDADYWRRGTRGRIDPSTKRAPPINPNPDDFLQHFAVKFRKGFGFGFELGAAIGFMPETSLASGGADIRVALLEGFRSGFMGYVPDLSVGSGVRTITGTSQFQLTIASSQVQASKPIVVMDSSIITPWVGYQQLWVFGDSGLVDLTPATDAVQYCNYAGQNVPGSSDPGKSIADGQPVCLGGSPLDFNNNVVFKRARLERRRILAGINYRYEMLTLGAEFITDVGSVSSAQSSRADKDALRGEKRQWTLAFDLGAAF